MNIYYGICPPIAERDTLELIAIANGTLEEWQREAIKQATDELIKRNVTREEQDIVLDEWGKDIKKAEEEYRKSLHRNASEKYSVFEILKIVSFAPLYLIGKGFDTDSIWDLKAENYKMKIKQRLLAILGGVIIWTLFITFSVDNYERKRLEEIDNVDISEWENNRINQDSI